MSGTRPRCWGLDLIHLESRFGVLLECISVRTVVSVETTTAFPACFVVDLHEDECPLNLSELNADEN